MMKSSDEMKRILYTTIVSKLPELEFPPPKMSWDQQWTRHFLRALARVYVSFCMVASLSWQEAMGIMLEAIHNYQTYESTKKE